MILGLGIDIVELERIRRVYKRFGEVFLKKILSIDELPNVPSLAIPWLGGRFAAKEAASKALGTGFSNGVNPCDISILSARGQKPEIFFHGMAKTLACNLGMRHAHVSISHERQFAIAEVILED